MKRTNLVRLFLVLELLAGLVLVARPAAAHTEDSKLQLSSAPAGPFAVTVWSYPSVLRAGSIHFTVAVADAESGRPVIGSNVQLQVVPDNGGAAMTSVAVTGQGNEGHVAHDPGSSFLYETDLRLMEEGNYQIQVQVSHPQMGSGATGFAAEVVPATGYKWVVSLLLVQAFATAVWLVKEGVTTWSKPMVWNTSPRVLASQRSAVSR